MIIPFFGLEQVPHPVVLGVHALGTPALEGGQQPGIALGLQPLIAGLFNPVVEQPSVP